MSSAVMGSVTHRHRPNGSLINKLDKALLSLSISVVHLFSMSTSFLFSFSLFCFPLVSLQTLCLHSFYSSYLFPNSHSFTSINPLMFPLCHSFNCHHCSINFSSLAQTEVNKTHMVCIHIYTCFP